MQSMLRASERLYGALLSLYPARFRAAHAHHMRLTYRDACRAAYSRGGTHGVLAFWLPTLIDLFKSALEQRARQGEINMSKARLIAWAGPLTLVVGAMWVAASIGDFAFQTGLLREEGLLGIVFIPFFLSFFPLLFAVIGTRLRFHEAAGTLGRLGLALSVVGSAGVLAAVLATFLPGSPTPLPDGYSWLNYAAVVCVTSIRIGYILFGIDALRVKPLPRWNVLPLLLGLTVVLSLPLVWFGVPAFLPSQWSSAFLHFALSGMCWVLLGIAMMSQPVPRQVEATA